jgi:hypothetical protein
MKILTAIAANVAGALIGVATNFCIWQYLARQDPDPTTGGAYCAAFIIFSVPSLIFGAMFGHAGYIYFEE